MLKRPKQDNQFYWTRFILMQRIISGILLISLFFTAIFFSTALLYALIALVTIGMLHEWYNMTKTDVFSLFLGLPIISIPMASIICITTMPYGKDALLFFACIIPTVDTFAMIGGQSIGGAKLSPRLSPSKTWSGFFVGIVAGGIVSLLLGFILQNPYIQFESWQFLLFGIILGAVEQMSDLFISRFKRKFKIKDTGCIIPGHGGVLDRFDGTILTAPLLLYILVQCTQN